MNYRIYILEDIPEEFRDMAHMIGVDMFVKCIHENLHLTGKLPSINTITVKMKHRKIREEYNGYNKKDLAIKYNYSIKQVENIVSKINI